MFTEITDAASKGSQCSELKSSEHPSRVGLFILYRIQLHMFSIINFIRSTATACFVWHNEDCIPTMSKARVETSVLTIGSPRFVIIMDRKLRQSLRGSPTQPKGFYNLLVVILRLLNEYRGC